MLAVERREKMLSLLQDNSVLKVEQLADLLQVTTMTIRRDLNYLQQRGLLERTFGAAFLKKNFIGELPYDEKKEKMIEEKKRIAKAAIQLIEPGSSILLDAGTTTFEIAKEIVNLKNINVITNDLEIGLFLSNCNNVKVILAGGVVMQRTHSCSDALTNEIISKFNVDFAFIGCNAFDVELGVNTTTIDKASVKQSMIKATDKPVLVADSSKYNSKSMVKIHNLNVFYKIITDDAYEDRAKRLHEQEALDFIYV